MKLQVLLQRQLSILLMLSFISAPAYGKTSLEIFKEAQKKGDSLLVGDKNKQALQEYKRARNAAKNIRFSKKELVEALFKVATCQERLKQNNQALASYEEALMAAHQSRNVLEFDVKSIRKSIARVSVASGNPEVMERIFDKALSICVDSSLSSDKYRSSAEEDAISDMISIYKKYKMNDAIIRLSEKLLAHFSDHKFARTYMNPYAATIADAYYAKKNYSKALRHYKGLLTRLGPVYNGNKEVPSSEQVRARIIKLLALTGQSKKAKHYKEVEKTRAASPKFDYKAWNKLIREANAFNKEKKYDKALGCLRGQERLLSKNYDGITSAYINLYGRFADLYQKKNDSRKASEYFKKALDVVKEGRKVRLFSKNDGVDQFVLKKYEIFLMGENREEELKIVQSRIANYQEQRKKNRQPRPVFRKEEITGKVTLTLEPSTLSLLAGSKNNFKMKVTNARYYKPIWIIETADGTNVTKDRKYGLLYPGLTYTGKKSASGGYANRNKCKYYAPTTPPAENLFLHVQILRKSDDGVIASTRVPLKILEPEIVITPQPKKVKPGEKIRFTATAKNASPDLIFEWLADRNYMDSDDPVFKNGNATLTGTFQVPKSGMFPQAGVSARLRTRTSYKIVKEATVTFSLPSPRNIQKFGHH